MITRQIARPKVMIWPDGTQASRLDLSAIVESFSTSKSIAAPAGTWTLRLLPSLDRGSRSISMWSGLAQRIRPNAVVSIGWDYPGGIMFGLVTSVARARNRMDAASDGLTLSGTDFGKLLISDSIVNAALTVQDYPQFVNALERVAPGNALANQLPGTFGPNRADGGHAFVQATVQEVADWILKTTTSVRIPMLAGLGSSDSSRVGDFMTAYVPRSWNDGRIQSENLWSYQGTIWGFLNQIVDPDFYEVFVDSYPVEAARRRGDTLTPVNVAVTKDLRDSAEFTSDGVVVTGRRVPVGFRQSYSVIPEVRLTIRPKPFDERMMEVLPTYGQSEMSWDTLQPSTQVSDRRSEHHIIDESEVLSEQMSISDAEVYSYYLVMSEYDLMGNPVAASEGLAFPAIDLYALQRHGVRQYQARLSLLASDVTSKETADSGYTQRLSREVLEFRNRLYNWYYANEYMESGSLQVAGRDVFRVGDPVYLPWKHPLRGGLRSDARASRGMRYYCVATQHSWSFGQPYTTTLSLTRGHNTDVLQQAQNDRENARQAYLPLTSLDLTAGGQ